MVKSYTIEELEKYLRDNEISFDDITDIFNGFAFNISISWGDWKHDHARLNYLMKEIGFTLLEEIVTEEDGSDSYSATHRYGKDEFVKLFNS